MDPSDRIAQNEQVFRQINERIEAGHWPADPAELVAFRCECASLGCNQLIELTLGDYEGVRADARHFVLLPGHEIPAVERIVDRRAAYLVVEKVGLAGKVAEATDPRGA